MEALYTEVDRGLEPPHTAGKPRACSKHCKPHTHTSLTIQMQSHTHYTFTNVRAYLWCYLNCWTPRDPQVKFKVAQTAWIMDRETTTKVSRWMCSLIIKRALLSVRWRHYRPLGFPGRDHARQGPCTPSIYTLSTWLYICLLSCLPVCVDLMCVGSLYCCIESSCSCLHTLMER